jgi:Uma2 family endonuclease
MICAGVFPYDARVELLEGVLTEQMTKYPPHNFTVGRLAKLLEDLVSPGWLVREVKVLVLGREWRPEPDLAVARGPDDRYRAVDPAAKDCILVIEVSEAAYAVDRGIKWRGYASAGIPAYWIVDLSKRDVEVYTSPAGRGKSARYRDTAVYSSGKVIPVVIAGRRLGTIAVDEILP